MAWTVGKAVNRGGAPQIPTLCPEAVTLHGGVRAGAARIQFVLRVRFEVLLPLPLKPDLAFIETPLSSER